MGCALDDPRVPVFQVVARITKSGEVRDISGLHRQCQKHIGILQRCRDMSENRSFVGMCRNSIGDIGQHVRKTGQGKGSPEEPER
jgi:hypothetical protein